jgi:hypothetical protein
MNATITNAGFALAGVQMPDDLANMRCDTKSLAGALRACVLELSRERQFRRKCYPRWVRDGKIKAEDELVQMARLDYSIQVMKRLALHVESPDIFALAREHIERRSQDLPPPADQPL